MQADRYYTHLKRQHFGIQIAILVLAAGVGCHKRMPEGPKAKIALHMVQEYHLRDPEQRIEWLAELSCLADGSFVQSDRSARVIRHFDRTGILTEYLYPKDLLVPFWEPRHMIVDSDRNDMYVISAGTIVHMNVAPGNNASGVLFQHPYVGGHYIRTGTDGRIFLSGMALEKENIGTLIHIVRNGKWVRSFYKMTDNEKVLRYYVNPKIALDEKGQLYVVGELDPLIHVYSADGDEVDRWSIPPNPAYRKYTVGFNPFTVTRDVEMIRGFERTFTIFARLEYLRLNGMIVVFERNDDPPEHPNMLDWFSKDGKYMGSTAVNGYLVGCDKNDNLYFSNYDRIVDGPLKITRYRVEGI